MFLCTLFHICSTDFSGRVLALSLFRLARLASAVSSSILLFSLRAAAMHARHLLATVVGIWFPFHLMILCQNWSCLAVAWYGLAGACLHLLPASPVPGPPPCSQVRPILGGSCSHVRAILGGPCSQIGREAGTSGDKQEQGRRDGEKKNSKCA